MPADFAAARPPSAVIFDVDGVLIDSPHERAWREALLGITDPARLTTEIYQAHVAGKPRLSGARAVLEALRLPDDGPHVGLYADRKQRRRGELIAAGDFTAFPDALRCQGKPHPEISLLAAAEVGVASLGCLAVEDAAAGVAAARAGGMVALGVASLGDAVMLRVAGADLVVTGLDEVAVEALAEGHPRARPK
jgi:beta-phosphoglucomutase-like phosphatase (HAD superfamily)